ncbi:hypothetical protein GH714_004534 [Hevea brasiliensis]|uniref:Uncharacterized protein n=1 Tax=Hevea brasiliensis TaxID=3981 RepID=A0A6A6LVD8_HEVBR|nr:hypothetical protein GH714_004534 [Hevea brasiliensis]
MRGKYVIPEDVLAKNKEWLSGSAVATMRNDFAASNLEECLLAKGVLYIQRNLAPSFLKLLHAARYQPALPLDTGKEEEDDDVDGSNGIDELEDAKMIVAVPEDSPTGDAATSLQSSDMENQFVAPGNHCQINLVAESPAANLGSPNYSRLRQCGNSRSFDLLAAAIAESCL